MKIKLRLFNLIASIALGSAACSPNLASPTSTPISTQFLAYPAPVSTAMPLPAYPAPTIPATNLPLPTLPAGIEVRQFQEILRWGEGPLRFISLSPSASQYLVATPTKAWVTPANFPEKRIELQTANTTCQEPYWSNTSVRWMKGEKGIAISYFGGICIWNTSDGSLLAYIQSEVGAASLDVSPDGAQVVWTGASSPAWIAPIKGSSPRRELQGAAPEGYAWGDAKLVWSPDGTRIAGVALGPTAISHYIAIWDAESGKLLERFPEINAHSPNSTKSGLLKPVFGCSEVPAQIEWSPNMRFVASLHQVDCGRQALTIWEVESQKETYTYQTSDLLISDFTWSPDSEKLSFSDHVGDVTVVDLSSNNTGFTKRVHIHGAFGITFSGPHSLTLAHFDGTLTTIADIFSNEPYQMQKIVGEFTYDASVLAWGASQQLIAIGGPDGVLRLWNMADKGWANSFNGHNGLIKDVVWSADTGLLASVRDLGGLGDPSVRIWRVGSEQPVQEFMGGYGALALSPDASLIAMDLSSEVWVFDLQTGERIEALVLNQSYASLAWSPNGRWLATLTPEQLILWDAQTWQISRTVEKPNASSLAWSPNSHLLAWSGGDTNTIQIQDVDNWRLYQVIQLAETMGQSLTWSPDGVHLAGDQDGVKIWNVATGELEFEAPTPVADLAWNIDGSKLAGISDSGQIYIWGLDLR